MPSLSVQVNQSKLLSTILGVRLGVNQAISIPWLYGIPIRVVAVFSTSSLGAAYNCFIIATSCRFLNAAVLLFSLRFALRAFSPPHLAFLSVGDQCSSQVFLLSWDA